MQIHFDMPVPLELPLELQLQIEPFFLAYFSLAVQLHLADETLSSTSYYIVLSHMEDTIL